MIFSPSLFMAKTKKQSKSPGKKAKCQEPPMRYFIDSDRIIPIDGLDRERPKPKNEMADSCKIAWGKSKIRPTSICGKIFGRMWFLKI